eukprot:TRINITY_DN7993_c0_g1_i1.p1 TRINITY_DN7993_c0_g1~~TRINITY_DN7993_c0_g1_i1.p1  ORF type:complete len:362 (-),score=47.10 TRINITY_DN7993_c0_g1_i1:14-1099(-)
MKTTNELHPRKLTSVDIQIMASSDEYIGWVVNEQWEVTKEIGHGGFGSIYKATDVDDGTTVAVKTERRSNKSYLDREIDAYEKVDGEVGFPSMLWHGECDDLGAAGKKGSCNVLVMDLLGPSLSDLYYANGKRFSLKSVCMLAIQMISRLEILHGYGIIHRDIKPGNFVMGRDKDAGLVSLLDFGLCSYYINNKKKHIPYKENASFRGTHRYASINAHMKVEQSRRDDLEALAYVLIYFMKGKLPWQNIKVSKKKRREKIGRMKEKISILELTMGMPKVFQKFLNYTRNLVFDEHPDYEYMIEMWKDCMSKHNYEMDYLYDWSVTSSESESEDQVVVTGQKRKRSENGESNHNAKRVKLSV